MQRSKTIKLSGFVENPDNPSIATDEEIARLAGKLKRVPLGLTAMRIAYVTDSIKGKRMVISGNKRLRVLKQAYGENGEVPSEWFADVTAMSEAERHEFIVTANLSDGSWDWSKLLRDYDHSELIDVGFSQGLLDSVGGSMLDDLEKLGEELGDREKSEGKSAGVLLHLPPEWMPVWRSYNRTFGSDEIVSFVVDKLTKYKAEHGGEVLK